MSLGVVGGVAAAFIGLGQCRLVSGRAQGVALGVGGVDVGLKVADLLLAGGGVVGVAGVAVICATQCGRQGAGEGG